jgi:hypothetical protein
LYSCGVNGSFIRVHRTRYRSKRKISSVANTPGHTHRCHTGSKTMPCKARCRVVVVIGDLFQHRLDISHPPPVTWQSRRLIFAVLIFSVSYLSILQLTSRTVPKRWTPRSYSTCRAVDGNTPSDKYASRSAGYFSNAELPAQLSRGPEIECALHTRTALTVSVAMALAGDHATASISITYEYYYTTSKTLRTEKQVGRQQLMSTELLYIGSTAN